MEIHISSNVTNTAFKIGYNSPYVDPLLREEFSKYMAGEISKLVVKAIDSQKYSKSWVPLNPSYKEWKRKKGLSTKIWEATGYLKLNIGYNVHTKYIEVGIHPTAKYKNGQSVLQVARWLEYGTKNMPERPLFRTIIIYVRKNIRYFYEKFLRERSKYEVPYNRWSS